MLARAYRACQSIYLIKHYLIIIIIILGWVESNLVPLAWWSHQDSWYTHGCSPPNASKYDLIGIDPWPSQMLHVCMELLPTFGSLMGQMLVNIPYMEHMGISPIIIATITSAFYSRLARSAPGRRKGGSTDRYDR